MPKTASAARARPLPANLPELSADAYGWQRSLGIVFDHGVARHRQMAKDASGDSFFNPGEIGFLEAIGHTPQEFYDFVDDHIRYGGDPDWGTTLLVASVRRDYFLRTQRGIPSAQVIEMEALPAKDAELDGVRWLPRLIEKARAKLRGEMPADLMYNCAGDRKFFRERGVHPADFLREAWASDFDPARLLGCVRKGN